MESYVFWYLVINYFTYHGVLWVLGSVGDFTVSLTVVFYVCWDLLIIYYFTYIWVWYVLGFVVNLLFQLEDSCVCWDLLVVYYFTYSGKLWDLESVGGLLFYLLWSHMCVGISWRPTISLTMESYVCWESIDTLTRCSVCVQICWSSTIFTYHWVLCMFRSVDDPLLHLQWSPMSSWWSSIPLTVESYACWHQWLTVYLL